MDGRILTVLAFAVEGMSSTWPLSQRRVIFSPWETFPEGGKYRSGTMRWPGFGTGMLSKPRRVHSVAAIKGKKGLFESMIEQFCFVQFSKEVHLIQ